MDNYKQMYYAKSKIETKIYNIVSFELILNNDWLFLFCTS